MRHISEETQSVTHFFRSFAQNLKSVIVYTKPTKLLMMKSRFMIMNIFCNQPVKLLTAYFFSVEYRQRVPRWILMVVKKTKIFSPGLHIERFSYIWLIYVTMNSSVHSQGCGKIYIFPNTDSKATEKTYFPFLPKHGYYDIAFPHTDSFTSEQWL